MKNLQKFKSHSHKEENTHKFETFNEKLSKINLSSVNNLKRKLFEFNTTDNDDDDDISYFSQTLEKWNDLNCTNDFHRLRHSIGSPLDVKNLVQIIHKKKFLVNLLIDEMQKQDNKALEVILDLLIALSRDLQSEFYEFFPAVFNSIIDLSLHNDNAETIEKIFICQTFLFKYLWKYIVKDIEQHFQMFEKAFVCKKDYIVNFTSETFAFLIRRTQQPEKLFKIIFDKIANKFELTRAIGRIIFESIKGIQGDVNEQNAQKFLPICFNFLSQENSNEIFVSIKYFLTYSMENFPPKSHCFSIIWKLLLIETDNQYHQAKLIELIHHIVCYKNCKFVQNEFEIIEKSKNYLFQLFDGDIQEKLLEIIQTIIKFRHEKLISDENRIKTFCENFFLQTFKQNEWDERFSLRELMNFTIKIIDSPLYDQIIDQYIQQLLQKLMSNPRADENDIICVIEFFSYLIAKKKSRPLFGNELYKIQKYSFNMVEGSSKQIIIKKLCIMIENFDENYKLLYSCLVVLSSIIDNHDSIQNDFNFNNVLQWIDSHISSRQSLSNDENLNIYAEILYEAMVFAILNLNPPKFKKMFTIEMLINCLKILPNCTKIFQTFDLLITYNVEKLKSEEFHEKLLVNLTELFPLLEQNISSPSRSNRLISLHILTLLNLNVPISEENPHGKSIFHLCLNAELIPVTLEHYRERLRLIWKLDSKYIELYLPKISCEHLSEIRFDLIAVHFLLGALYENLSVLWKPIVDVIETYAKQNSDKPNKFLEILFNHFHRTKLLLESNELFDLHPNLRSMIIVDDNIENKDINTPDHFNHRIWLLKCFERFPNLIERKNKEFIDSFFEFLSKEFAEHYICRDKSRENISVTNDDNKNDKNINNKTSWKTFFAYLQVFEKFKNPKAMHKEKELYEIYLNLLSSPNQQCQKHALNCLLTYNHHQNDIGKYRENFQKLIDDKSFVSEINSFMIRDNIEDNVIAIEDREKIVPYFLRILIGKMLSSSGTKTHGKTKIDFMRSLIMKILSSFDEDQQLMFIELVYSSISKLIKTNYSELLSKISEEFIDIKSFLPFKHFQSYIVTLEFLMKHFGNKSVNVMKLMYKVLIILSIISTQLLSNDHRHQIKDYYQEQLKSFRTNCFKCFEYFFNNFHSYPYEIIEIDLLFDTLVKSLVKNLTNESQNFPSPLLRLFNVWSENPRYFPLLIKHYDEDFDSTPLNSIIQLFNNPKLSSITINFIEKLLENLLIADDSMNPLEISNFNYSIPSAKKLYPEFADKSIKFGSLILIPFINAICERIKLNYQSKSNRKFSLQEINILARLSLYVTNPNDSHTMITLLIRSISRKKRPEEEKEIFILKILTHLSKNLFVNSFETILDSSYDLFYLVEKPLPRKELCNFLINLSKNIESFTSFAKLICDLNSYNPKYPDEPDYDLRITTFNKVSTILQEYLQNNRESLLSSIQLKFIDLLLINCSFFLNKLNDFSIRELSSSIILKLIEIFYENESEILFKKYIIDKILFNIITNGIQNSNETISTEFIQLLAKIIDRIKMGKNIHIDQLRLLCNDDDEVDFWKNICHIQLHRRSRALNRLIQNEQLLRSLSSVIHQNFLIPIVENFIKYSTDNNNQQMNASFLNTSIESLAIFLQYCSWNKYDTILTRHINNLIQPMATKSPNHQQNIDPKISIKIISMLLEKFSFLKPENVIEIEKTFHKNDFESIKLEYINIDNFNINSKSRKSKKILNNNHKLKGKTSSNKNGKDQNNDKRLNEKNCSTSDTIITKDLVDDNSNNKNDNDEMMTGENVDLTTTGNQNNNNDEDDNDCDDSNDRNENNDNSNNKINDLLYYKKIYESLCKKLLPMLHKCLHQQSRMDNVHDMNKMNVEDDDDNNDNEQVQIIPSIGLAIIKLMKHIQLDKQLFLINLNSIILRLCQFLQSKMFSIREISRKTMAQILMVIGSEYFSNIFNQMKSMLLRGYQRHVFIYTVYVLLQNLTINVGDLDDCMMDLIQLCHDELFGSLSEEKEISQIITKTKEAKKIKSYDIYEILAKSVSNKALTKLIEPLKSLLQETNDYKNIQKIEKSFHSIGRGLVHNKYLDLKILIKFLIDNFILSSANLIDHNIGQSDSEDNEKQKKKIQRVDSFLISKKAFHRVNQRSKINTKSNLHVILNFALECYQYILKNHHKIMKINIDNNEQDYQNLLNETLKYLELFLRKSNDLKVIITTLQCLSLIFTKFDYCTKIDQNYNQSIVEQLFLLLKKYSGLTNDHDTKQLITLSFKLLSFFIQNVDSIKLSDEQLSILILLADSDIDNNDCQNVSIYYLLKSIIRKKFITKEFHQLMERIMVVAIKTDIDTVRNNSIELYVKYLLYYPIDNNRMKGKLLNLAKQLEVDHLSGRKAACIMLKNVLENISMNILSMLTDQLFIILSLRLINEDSIECLSILNEMMKIFLKKLNENDLEKFFNNFVIELWLKSTKSLLKQILALKLIQIYLENEKENFQKRLSKCLPIIIEQMDVNNENFQSLNNKSMTQFNNNNKSREKINNEDNLVFHQLNFISKLLRMEFIQKNLSDMNNEKVLNYFDKILTNITETYLLHPHVWIRNICLRIFGQIFSLFEPELILIDTNKNFLTYYSNSHDNILMNIARKFTLIFRDIYSEECLAEQLIKNLIYIARLFIIIDDNHVGDRIENGTNDDDDDDGNDKNEYNRCLFEWLLKKLLFEIKFEIKNKPNITRKRILFVKWLAAISLKLSQKNLRKYLSSILLPLCREIISNDNLNRLSSTTANEQINDELKNLSKQVLQMLRNMIGDDELFLQEYNKCRNQISHRRIERKKQRAIQMVTNTAAGVKRKQRKHQRNLRKQKSKRRGTNRPKVANEFSVSSF